MTPKQAKKRFLFFLLVLVLLGNCGPTGRQADVNRVTRAFALTVRTFIGFFEDDLGSCDAFLQVFDEISTDSETCDNGEDGLFQVTKGGTTCEGGASPECYCSIYR